MPARPRPRAWVRGGAAAVALAAAVAACGATDGGSDPPPAIPARSAPAAHSHVVVVVMENKEEGRVLGTRDAPFLGRLADRGGVAARSYGVRHPSLPNYVALVSGSTPGITHDCPNFPADAAQNPGPLQSRPRTP